MINSLIESICGVQQRRERKKKTYQTKWKCNITLDLEKD